MGIFGWGKNKEYEKYKEGMGSVGRETTDAIRKRKKALQDAMKE